MNITLIFQILAILFSFAASLIFAAPTVPRLRKYVRPTTFENGWYTLVLFNKLNYRDEGFSEILGFLLGHQTNDGHFVDSVTDDLGIDASEIEPDEGTPAVEEIRILTKPPDWREQILVCYDKDTEGPPGEPDETKYHEFTRNNTSSFGDDWRWFGPLSACEHNAQKYTTQQIDKWTSYGAIALAIGVVFQLLVIAL